MPVKLAVLCRQELSLLIHPFLFFPCKGKVEGAIAMN